MSREPSSYKEVRSLVKLHVYVCGKSEIPTGFHVWSLMSMVAAVLGDRVWIEKLRGEPLFPHLYIILIGPSGAGKGGAISRAYRLLKTSGLDVNVWRGGATAAFLVDLLGERERVDEGSGGERQVVVDPRLWLIMDELSNDIGSGPHADEMIKMMTELFTGQYTFSKGTRTHGGVSVDNACINWLAGTTKQWLKDSVKPQHINSGFSARVIFVNQGYKSERYVRPIYPPDCTEAEQFLVARLRALRHINGPFTLSPEAAAYEYNWYMNRKAPEHDETLMASFRREHDMLLKFAMLYSVMDGYVDRVVHVQHITQAAKTCGAVRKSVPQLIEMAQQTEVGDQVERVAAVLEKYERVDHVTLAKRLHRKGVTGKLLKSCIEALLDQGRASLSFEGPAGRKRVYTWVGEGS